MTLKISRSQLSTNPTHQKLKKNLTQPNQPMDGPTLPLSGVKELWGVANSTRAREFSIC